MLRRAAILLLGPIACLPLQAQEQRPLIGRVVDGSGAPLVGAAVTVAWNPGGAPQFGKAVTASGETDARGYFKVPAPRATPLFAWAIGKPAADGAAQVTAIVECQIRQPRLELAARHAVRAQPIRVQGIEAWRDLGPFTLSFHPTLALDLSYDAPVDETSAAVPPLLPFAAVFCELRTARGEPLLCEGLAEELVLHPPQPLPIEAVDGDGKPVVGAAILHRVGVQRDWPTAGAPWQREQWRVVATTDADGKATALLPLPAAPLQAEKPANLVLLARKEGCADTHSGFWERWFVDGNTLPQGDAPPALRFTLKPAAKVVGRLSLPGAVRPAALAVLWTSKITFRGGWTHLPRSSVVPVAEDGSFALSMLPEDAYQLSFHCAPIVLAAGQDRGEARVVPVALPALDSVRDSKLELGSEALRPTTVKILAADAAPLAAMRVFVANVVEGSLQLEPPAATLQIGPSGLGEVLVATKDAWLLAIGEQGYAFAQLAGQDLATIELRLQPLPQVTGRVVDAEQRPVAGARIQIHRTSIRGGMGGEDALPLSALSSFVRQHHSAVSTDADGQFVLRFLPRPGLSMQARAAANGLQSESFAVEETAESLTLVLR